MGLRQLTLDLFSVLLAGFLTEENGSSLTEVESVHMQILRTMSQSKAVIEISTCIYPL